MGCKHQVKIKQKRPFCDMLRESGRCDGDTKAGGHKKILLHHLVLTQLHLFTASTSHCVPVAAVANNLDDLWPQRIYKDRWQHIIHYKRTGGSSGGLYGRLFNSATQHLNIWKQQEN